MIVPLRQINKEKAALFITGCFLGAFFFLLLYGVRPIVFTNDDWLRYGFVEKDCVQHYAGWLFYRSSPLSFPFCVTSYINSPEGLSIAYTDSIPLFAVLFRLFSFALPSTFQYFGFFVFISYALQGGFACLLFKRLHLSNLLCILGSILFVISPIMTERAFRHCSLTAHFLILWAIEEYFAILQEKKPFRCSLLFCLMLSVGIHPYLTAMVAAICAAAILDYLLQTKQWLKSVLSLAVYSVSCVITAYIFGLASGSSSGGSDVQYGYFSLNLNAFWNPISRWNTRWSLLLPVQNQTNGNYDAFCYFGVGAMALLGISVIQFFIKNRLKGTLAFLVRHAGLLLCSCFLTVFAVSHVVTANGATLFTLPLPTALVQLFTVFRSSGRMIWPVYYLLLVFAFAGITRYANSRRTMALIAFVIALQVIDLSPGFLSRSKEMRAYQAEFQNEIEQSQFWQKAADQYTSIQSLDGLQEEPLFLALWAADHQISTNDPFAARYNENTLEAAREETISQLKNGIISENTLYLVQDEGLFLELCGYVDQDQVYCAQIADKWFVLAPHFEYDGEDAVRFSDRYPIHICQYNDDNWQDGVLSWDHKTILFYDCAYIRNIVDHASSLQCDIGTYEIEKVDYKDAGWIMVTLNIDDASVLVNKDLEGIY